MHFREQYGSRGKDVTFVKNKIHAKFNKTISGEEYLYVTPIDQDNTIVRVTINGKKPPISKSFFLLKLLKTIFLPQGELKFLVHLLLISYFGQYRCFHNEFLLNDRISGLCL